MSQTDTGASRVRLRDAYRFFMPLMLTAELTMVSHAIVAGFLARMDNPAPILAAYSIAFFFHSTMGSPLWACQMVSVSYIRDRASVRRMLAFSAQVMCAVGWVWLALGLTPLGDRVFGDAFGLRPEVVRDARLCTTLLFLMLPLVAVRSVMYATMMRARRTLLVSYGTVVRLIALGAALPLLSLWLDGAVVGAAAIICCISVETTYSVLFAWPIYRRFEPRSRPLPRYREIWVFAWPIMVMHAAEQGVNFLVSLFLGRLPRPELALAAYGVVDSILKVLLSPLRNLTLTLQALAQTRTDLYVIGVFCVQITLIFAAVLALAFIPAVNDFALRGAMGLTDEIADYAGLALGIGVPLALMMGLAATTRGLLITCRSTAVLALSSGLRLVAVAAVGGLGVAVAADNGAALGLFALTAAFGVEGAILLVKTLQLKRRGKLNPGG
ncbi:MAG: hypothetical protein AAF458_19225 [Pseudomonadota bacterium]